MTLVAEATPARAARRTRWRRRYVLGAVLGLVLGVLASFVLLEPDTPAEVLEARYATPPSRFVTVRGVRLHVRDEGVGPAVLLLHGMGASLHTWDAWTAALTDRYRVIRVDLPGYGLTGPMPDHDYRVSRYLPLLDGLLDSLGVDRVAVAGNSFGGHLAFRYALDRPARVTHLVLIDASGFLRHGDYLPGAGLVQAFFRLPGVVWFLSHLDVRPMVRSTMRSVYAEPSRLADTTLARYEALIFRPGNRQTYLDFAWAAEPTGFDRLGTLAVPTLIQWGAKDPWMPLDVARGFQRAIRGSTLIVYDDAGHLPMEETPGPTVQDVRRFLEAHPPR